MSTPIANGKLAHVRYDIAHRHAADLRTLFSDMHPADIAGILDGLYADKARYAFRALHKDQVAEVTLHLTNERQRQDLLGSLSSEEVAREIIRHFSSDDAADVLAAMPEERRTQVLALLQDARQRADVQELLGYPEGTAGALMVKELVKVPIHATVRTCVKELRKYADRIEDIYRIYVVDDQEKFVGWLRLSDVFSHTMRTPVREVMETGVRTARTGTDVEEVGHLMERYDLVVIAVVDEEGHLKGRITIDDVLDVIQKEDTEDALKMAGIETLDLPYVRTGVLSMVRKRATWLVILFVSEMFTATAMGFFEGEIQKAVILALFVPLIISSGGNSGSQAATLIIRAMALRELTLADWWFVMRKEIISGLLLGGILGVIGFARILLWQKAGFYNYGPYWLAVAATVSFSLIFIVLWGTLAGSMIPFILKRLKLDPATSSAPFVATLVDVTGLVIYFTVAALFLKGKLL